MQSIFCVSVFDVTTTKSTVCSKLFVKNFLPPVCSPLGAVCIDKIRRPEVRKHSVKNAGKFKMAPVNFGDAEEFL